MAGAVLALASNNIGKDNVPHEFWSWKGTDTTPHETHLNTQEAAFEESYGRQRDHIHFEIVTHRVIEHSRVNTRLADASSLGEYRAHPLISQFTDEFFIIGNMGTSVGNKTMDELMRTGGEFREKNQIEAGVFSIGLETAKNFKKHSPGMATTFQTVSIHDNGARFNFNCSMYSVPFHMDRDTFLREMTHHNLPAYVADIEADIADLRSYVDNHELAHCVTINVPSHEFIPTQRPVWFDESVADLYAVARHIQQNGNDGFAEDVIAMREMGAWKASRGEMQHYTSPVLKRALPHLIKAAENNQLEGKDPYELMDFVAKKVFQNPIEPDAFENITKEFQARKNSYRAIYDGAYFLEENSAAYQKLLADMGVETADLNAASDAYTQAEGHLFRKIQDKKALDYENESRLHLSMQELLNTQPDIHQAYVVAAYRTHHAERTIREVEKESGITQEQALAERGASGLTLGRELEIYQAYKTTLESQIAAQQEARQKEPDTVPDKEPEMLPNT